MFMCGFLYAMYKYAGFVCLASVSLLFGTGLCI